MTEDDYIKEDIVALWRQGFAIWYIEKELDIIINWDLSQTKDLARLILSKEFTFVRNIH